MFFKKNRNKLLNSPEIRMLVNDFSSALCSAVIIVFIGHGRLVGLFRAESANLKYFHDPSTAERNGKIGNVLRDSSQVGTSKKFPRSDFPRRP